MASLLHEIGKDAFEKTRDIEAGERVFCLITWFHTMADRVWSRGAWLLLKEELMDDGTNYKHYKHIEEKICKEGLPFLKEEAAKAPPEIGLYQDIQWAAGLVCDDCDPENIIELSAARYRENNFQGEDALLYYMLILGFLKIREEEWHSRSIEQFLLACLSCEAEERYHDYWERKYAPIIAAQMERTLHDAPVFWDEQWTFRTLLEEKILQAEHNMILRWLCDVELRDCETALKGLSPAARQKILSNLPGMWADMCAQDFVYMEPVSRDDLMEVLKKLLAIFEAVERMPEEE